MHKHSGTEVTPPIEEEKRKCRHEDDVSLFGIRNKQETQILKDNEP